MSLDVVELISKMLAFNPADRFSMNELFEHDWLKGEYPSTEQLVSFMEGLKEPTVNITVKPDKGIPKKTSSLINA